MTDEFLPAQDSAPELAQDPTQAAAPATEAPTGPPDYKAKRSKFLAKFKEIDPEGVGIDEPTLAEVLADAQKGPEFASYVTKLNPDFGLSAEELASQLGYEVKKKPGGGVSGSGVSGLNPAKMQEALGVEPEDIAPTAQVSLRSAMEKAPGDEYIDAGLPLPSGEELRAQEEARQREAAAATGDGFFATAGKQLSNLPATLENAAGNVLDYLGDMVEPLSRVGTFGTPYGVSYSVDGVGQGNRAPVPVSELNAPLRDDKPTDQAGAFLRADAANRTTEVSAKAKQSVLDDPTNGAAWGNLLGQGANSIAAIAASSLAGGPAAGIAAGAALGVSSTKDAARDAGLSDKEAMLTATVLAPIQGILEETGTGFITKNKAVTGLLTKTIVGRTLAATGGKLSETALVKAASAIMPEVVKRGIKSGAGEAFTEFLQGEAEGLTKLGADALRNNPEAPAGQGRYGVSAKDALVKSPLEQAAGGFLLGGGVGAFHGDSTPAQAPATTEAAPLADTTAPQLAPPEAPATPAPARTVTIPGPKGDIAVELNEQGAVTRLVAHDGTERSAEWLAQEAPATTRESVAKYVADALVSEQQPLENAADSITPNSGNLKSATDTPINTPNSPADAADSKSVNLTELEKSKAPEYSTPTENRKAGSFVKDGQTYTRQQPLADRPVKGNETTVHFSTGEAQPARFALIEAADLQPSHTGGSQNLTHFLPEAQPKNRSAAFDKASQKAIDEIAAKPDTKQLGDAPTAYAGAPVVNSRGEVIQGNGRSEGVRQHYKQGGKTYRADILAEAQRVGIDPKAGRAMKEPVLVRLADVSDQRAQQLGSYTAADTESGGVRRLDVKQAAQRLDTDMRADLARILTPKADGTLTETIRGNQAELVRFLQKNKLANGTQLQTLVKADGTLTPQGVEDVTALHRQTLFADADPNLPELFQELPAAAQNGLDRAVGHLASLPEKDSILPELHTAIAGVREYKASGTDFATWAGQRDLYATEGQAPSEKYNPLELKLIKLLADEKRPTYISRAFDEFARAVKGQEGDLFAGKPAIPRAEAITQTFQVNDQPRRNASREESAARPSVANGRPTPPDAPAVPSPAENAQRGTQPDASNPKRAGIRAKGAAGQQLTESKKAKIQASIDEAAERIKQRRAARQQEGKLFSSPLGIGEIDPEDLKDALTIAKGHIKLGALKVKVLVAKIREAGLDEQAAPTEALRPHLKKLLAKQEPAAIATKERRHAARYDEATRSAFTSDEARYAPKKLIENAATARDYIHQVGLENAYSVALDKPDGFASAAHVEVQESVATEYRRLSDEARKAGDKAQAEAYWQRAKDVRAKKVSALTDAAQTLAQVQGFIESDPGSVLDAAIKTTEAQRKPLLAKAEKEGVKVAGQAIKARRRAMRDTLNSEAVRAAREVVAPTKPVEEKPTPEPTGYGQRNVYFNKARALQAKEALRKLGLSTIIPPELVNFVGYHVESLARAGGKHSFAEVSKRVIRDLGARVKPLLPEAYEQAKAKYLKNGGAGSEAGFTSSEDVAKLIAPQAVKVGVKQLGTTLDKIARLHAEGVGMAGKTLAERFTAEAGLDPKAAKVYADAVEAEYAKQVMARKKELGHRIVNFATHALLGRNAATAVDELLSTLNLATDPASAGELLKAHLNLPDISIEQADHFTKLAEAVRTARPGNDRSDRVQDLVTELGKLKHVSWGDVGESLFMANILSGPLTQVKNLTANAQQAAAEGFISTLHTWASTGSLRAAAGPARGVYNAQRRAFAEASKIISTGYTGTGAEKWGHVSLLENNHFKGAAAPLNGLKFVGRALTGADGFFNMGLRGMRSHELALKNAFTEAKRQAGLNGEKLSSSQLYERAYTDALGILHGLPDLRAAAESQAEAEGLAGSERTRRVGELVNEAVNKQQDRWQKQAEAEGLTGVNKAQRIGELQEEAQPDELVADAAKFAAENTFNNGFEGRLGVIGNLLGQMSELPVGKTRPLKAVLPFVKIITAVQNRRLDWTPWGIVRAAKGSIGPEQYAGGKFYREYTNEEREKLFLKSTLGTVSALALYSLAKAGVISITGTMFGDRDDEQQSPNTSIKWANGLFTSYKDNTNEILLAAIGNTLEYERKQDKAGKHPDTAKRLAVIVGLTSAYTLSMGPMRGLDDFNKNVLGMMQRPDQGVNYALKLATSTAKGMIPYSALDQQLLQGLNVLSGQNVKETISTDAWNTAYNQLVQDVPVARDAMGDMVDILGDPIKASSTRLWGWMPQRSEVDQRGLDFLAAHELLPARSRVTDENLAGYDAKLGKIRPMTDAEFSTFQVVRGQAFKALLRGAMMRPSQNPAYSPEVRALLARTPAADRSLPELDMKAANKLVASLHKRAVEAGKLAVFVPNTRPIPIK